MMTEPIDQTFDSIESAQDFMQVLAETIFDAMKELNEEQRAAAKGGGERRAKAIELALFKLKMLTCYVQKSRRTLNDLRMLRRLILNERETVEQLIGAI